MISFAQAYLVSAFVSVIVGVFIYGENPTHVVNRMFLLVCGILFYYQFTLFEFLQAGNADVASQWMRFGAFWYLLPVAVLHLSMTYANLRIREPFLYSMYGFGIFFSLIEVIVAPYEFFKMPWGWDYHYTGYYGYVQVLWVTLPTIGALLVLGRRYHVLKSRQDKTGVAYVFFGVLIPVVTGILVTVLPFLTSVDMPDLTTPAAAMGYVIVGYAVFRYGTQVLTTSAAADEILSAMADPLFLVNPNMEIMNLNRAALQMLGCDTTELVGKQLDILIPDSNFLKTMLGNHTPELYETELRTRLRRTIPVSLSKSAITTKQGNLTGYVIICRDITERKRMEEQLLRSERLASIGEAAAMVGHDLRNPLQSTASTLYLARKLLSTRKVKDRMEAVELLEKLDNQVYYMDKIVSDLQDYARPVGAELIETSLPDLIKEAIADARIPGSVECSMVIQGDLSNAMTNPILMKRVLMNLINNAVQAMPKGGRLTITALKNHDSLTVAVQDTGLGIAQASLEKIFHPFYTTKAQGQGLGLAVCKRLVEVQGGTVTVKSEMGQGSTFTITIPNGTAGES